MGRLGTHFNKAQKKFCKHMFVDLYITHKTLFFATCWRIYVIWRDGHRTNQWMNLNKSFWWTNLKWTNILKESKFPSLMVTVSSAQLTAFAVLLLAVIKQRCITAGAPWILLDWGWIACIRCNAPCTKPRGPYRDNSVQINVPRHP